MSHEFNGAKLILFDEGRIVCLLRDDIPTIPWPNHWDFPGGGREGNETPVECALRELHEELNVALPAAAIHWQRRFTNPDKPDSWLLAAELPYQARDQLRLGDEGQAFDWMLPTEYIDHPRAIPALSQRLAVYMEEHC